MWGSSVYEFDLFLPSYRHFGSVIPKCNTAIRNSGGVSVFVKEDLLQLYSITRICHDFSNSVVLYLKCSMFKSMKDIILYVAYVSPEGSPIYIENVKRQMVYYY